MSQGKYVGSQDMCIRLYKLVELVAQLSRGRSLFLRFCSLAVLFAFSLYRGFLYLAYRAQSDTYAIVASHLDRTMREIV